MTRARERERETIIDGIEIESLIQFDRSSYGRYVGRHRRREKEEMTRANKSLKRYRCVNEDAEFSPIDTARCLLYSPSRKAWLGRTRREMVIARAGARTFSFSLSLNVHFLFSSILSRGTPKSHQAMQIHTHTHERSNGTFAVDIARR